MIVTAGFGGTINQLVTLGLGFSKKVKLSGGWQHVKIPIRSREDIEREREQHPLWPKVIDAVAARQARDLHLDEQQRLEELSRELKLAGIAWESRYLERLNSVREKLINEELASRLQLQQANQDTLLLLMAAAV